MRSGTVASVNISAGGVPKLPVDEAWVGELGLDGDKHTDDTAHGGPLRAVCLFATEVIERLQADGHPLRAGSVGENLTTSGIDWSAFPSGTRVKVGNELVLELVSPAMPCDTQRPNFVGGVFKWISPVLYPASSRIYARVLNEGDVRPGDAIEVVGSPEGNDPDAWIRFYRVDEAELEADNRLWASAAAAGIDIRVVVTDELAMAATPGVPDPAFNHALGLRTLPNLLPRVLDFYRDHGVRGNFGSNTPPWPGATAELQLAVLAADADTLSGHTDATEPPVGIVIRRATARDFPAIEDVVGRVFKASGLDYDAWSRILPTLLRLPSAHAVVAEIDGRVVATGRVSMHRKVALVRTGVVLPEARGRGIQRALIAERIRIALEDGSEIVAAHAGLESVSERNILACGMHRIGTRDVYAFDPARDAAPSQTERVAAA